MILRPAQDRATSGEVKGKTLHESGITLHFTFNAIAAVVVVVVVLKKAYC